MTITQPPLTARRWVAGLVELVADLIQQVGYVVAHVGDGVEAVANRLDPTPASPDTDCDDDSAARGPRVIHADLIDGMARIVDGDHVHYIPVADTYVHTKSDECPCKPSLRLEMTGRGDVWHITHTDMTGRPAPEGA